jgi:hypothetical protein
VRVTEMAVRRLLEDRVIIPLLKDEFGGGTWRVEWPPDPSDAEMPTPLNGYCITDADIADWIAKERKKKEGKHP